LNGRNLHLESIKNLDQIVKDEIINGVKTIVAVGDDKTFNLTLNAILRNIDVTALPGIALGIIPVGPNNSIANACGIKNDKVAGEIILARRVEALNVAKANDIYFLSEATIKAKDTKLHISDFLIDPVNKGEIRIINLSNSSSAQNILSNPQDDLLDLYIYNNPKKTSFFSIKELVLENPHEKLNLDNCVNIESPVKISLISNKINIIVSKDRIF
jgi:hypothetical protein